MQPKVRLLFFSSVMKARLASFGRLQRGRN
jgi:hypothetical protein